MPFSFNPTVSSGSAPAPQQQSEGAPSSSFSSTQAPFSDTPLSDAPQAPESPFLFLREREDDAKSVNAYLQLLLIFASILCIISAITLFAYSKYLQSGIEQKKTDLAQAEATFKEYPFEDMKKVSNRITAMNQLLKEYVSIRSPLKLLEAVVEDNVYFNEFSLTKEKKLGYVASFTVVTTNYKSLIQQLEALQLTQYTKVAPQPKYDGFKEENTKKSLTVRVTTPVIIQGVMPDDVQFLSSEGSSVNTTPQ